MFRKGKHRRPTPAGRRISRRGVALGLTLSLMTAGVAYADELIADGDALTTGNQASVAFGNVCQNDLPKSAPVSLWIVKQGGGGGGNRYSDGVSVSVTATVPANVTATGATIQIPGNWSTLPVPQPPTPPPTTAPVVSTVTLSAAAPLGAYSGSITFKATEPDGSPAKERIVSVTATVVACDTTAPTANPSVTPVPNSAGWNNTDVTVNWNWSDNVALGSPCTTSTSVTTEGVHNLTATCKDTAGNTGSASVTVRVDKTAPTISAALDKTPDAVSGWFNISTGAPTVQFTCGDAGGSGLAGACPANILVGEGAGLFGSGQSFTGGPISDVAGNTSTQASIGGIKVDLTAPTITADIVPGIPGSGWYMASPTVSFDCQDTGSSGLAGTCLASVPVGEGTGQSFSGGPIYDNAGNASGTDGVSGINVDLTPPTIEADLDRAAGTSGWFNISTGAPNVQFTCGDLGGSGLVGPCPADAPVGEGENQSVSGGPVYDLAGHSSGTATIDDIDVDLTAPTLTASISPAAPAGTGWYNASTGAPTVSFPCSDSLSGVAGACPTAVSLSEGAGQSVTRGPIYDNAGNGSGTAGKSNIDVDLTAPVVTLNGPVAGTQYVLGTVPTLWCGTSDALSGVATYSTSSTTGPASMVGTFTASCSAATDNAGNIRAAQSVQYQVIYAWNGFFRPIDNGFINIVKAGSSVPVKFSLGGNQGLSIFQGLPTSQGVNCGTNMPMDAVEETATPGSSGLSYDATTDTYNYVWKTAKNWTGCRLLTVTLIDGTTHTAMFNFTK